MATIRETAVSNIADYVNTVSDFASACRKDDFQVYFRGELDYGKSSLSPSVYREDRGAIKKEHILYREIIRFSDGKDFKDDKTTIDRLCRMQHYGCPTRMLDLSEDCFTALYFGIDGKEGKAENGDRAAVIYAFAIPKGKIKYYDSDAAAILANLAKLPLSANGGESAYGDKSKRRLAEVAREIIAVGMPLEEYNEKYLGFLLHHIREDKSHFHPIINLGDIFSVRCVKTRLNSDRILLQRGAFLLFGLNIHAPEKAIPLDGSYDKPHYWRDGEFIKWSGTPIKEILKIRIDGGITTDDLASLGISKPYIYPDMKDISDYLCKNCR